MFSSILAGSLCGIEADLVRVEVDISTGLPGFHVVGSPSSEVREARERVQVALHNAGFSIPPRKITVNLAPAHLKKEGTGFDLSIAVGLLQCQELFPGERTEGILFAGELGLNGEIKPIKGILPIVRQAGERGLEGCIVPMGNSLEASVIPGITVRGVEDIRQLIEFLQEKDPARREEMLPACPCTTQEVLRQGREEFPYDFAQVKGQRVAKRAAEIAAAGFHNLLMAGPPGGGKSMIARRIPGILPPLTWQECLEVSSIYSVAGLLAETKPLITQRPFQSPHHTISGAALVGGGSRVHPGAISLSHRGVLFLDELTEFPRGILENLRQPLEERRVHIARSQGSYIYPANFMLVCAMNPCKCGYYPDKNRCTCTESERRAYLSKLSGPLLERMDMYVETAPVELSNLKREGRGEPSARIRARVLEARARQEERFQGRGYTFNAEMEPEDIEKYCALGEREQKLMELAYENLRLSARSYYRILKVARTIADLEGDERVREKHLQEALAYRMRERRQSPDE